MPSQSSQQYVAFRVCEQTYALPIAGVDEIVPMVQLSRPPCAPKILEGFLNFGGQPVAVISLRRLFALPPRAPELYTPLIVLKSNAPRLAVEVDEVCRIICVCDNNIMPFQEVGSLNACATGTVTVDDEAALLLSPERLLLERERSRVAELECLERERLEALDEVSKCA